MSGEPTIRSDKQWIDALIAAHDKGYLEGYAAGSAAEKAKVARLRTILSGLTGYHEGYADGVGPCICAWHKSARAALADTAESAE